MAARGSITSVDGLQELVARSNDPRAEQLCALIRLQSSMLEQMLPEAPFERAQQLSGMCLKTAKEFSKTLAESGLPSNLLRGEIEFDTQHWMEHYVNLVPLSNAWVSVDLTAAQFEQFRNAEFVVVYAPSKRELGRALNEDYGWWLGNPA